ncbi:hypothetical protein NGA_0317800 [Nannochloropsis gaditana CCMP526]|nr:hypothetical protein NGA_0317800 [Nannochloropsis gaditana CCMP526]EKU20299.1 hypothetical protein NGA_0317800 [Nannochloropsis gaditana CCMP526]|eukprot:XP_005856052.1 hypothetical protein NGA_0317800 [Nannochloropsis gaditana CCMP526]
MEMRVQQQPQTLTGSGKHFCHQCPEGRRPL